MRSYNYKFTWNDKDGKYQRRYLEAASKQDAIIDFEKTFGLEMKKDHVKVAREYH